MSINLKFHFKCPMPFNEFVNSIKEILGIYVDKKQETESLVGEYLGFSSTLVDKKDQSSYFEDFEFYETINPTVKDYDVIFMLSSSAGQGIQEMTMFNIAYSIYFIYKIHGTLIYDDGGYTGTIRYVDEKIINFDTKRPLTFPKLENFL